MTMKSLLQNFLSLAVLSLVLSGCGGSGGRSHSDGNMEESKAEVARNVADRERAIREITQKIESIQNQLRVDRVSLDSVRQRLSKMEMASNSGCKTVVDLQIPHFVCHRNEDERRKMLASCALNYKGCDAVSSLYSSELDSSTESFFKSEMCSQYVAKLTGSSRSLEDAAVSAIGHYAKESCGNGFWGTLVGCSFALSYEVTVGTQFLQCVNGANTNCDEKRSAWAREVNDKVRSCQAVERDVTAKMNDISRKEREIRDLRMQLKSLHEA
jgi:septal ring factor EnvC (AmiA/AmiB activator)